MNNFTSERGFCPHSTDPAVLVRVLDAHPQFRRDTSLGAIFHRGKISFRQVAARDSLHITIEGDQVSTHIDRVSPLNCNPEQPSHYSARKIAAHNLTGMVEDVVGWARGPERFRRHRRNDQVVLVPKVLLAGLPDDHDAAVLDPEGPEGTDDAG